MFKKSSAKISSDNNNKEHEAAETLKANLARSRGQLHLKYLLFCEKELIKNKSEEKDQTKAGPSQLDDTLVVFKGINIAEPVSYIIATTFEQTKDIFKKGLACFTQASEFYVLDGFVTEHIEIYQDISSLYKALISFESDRSKKCKMHKRRIHKLEPLLEDLNKGIYLNFYRQLTDEVACTYGDLVDLKLAIRSIELRRASLSTSKKINDLAVKAIQHYEMWIKTFEVEGKEPNTLDSVYHKSYLTNMFAIARLHSKYFALDVHSVCEALNKSLKMYEKVVATAIKLNATCFNAELAICKEMIILLPIKISKINTTGVPFVE